MEERLRELLEIALNNNATDIHFLSRYNEIIIKMRVNNKMVSIDSKSGDDKLIRYLQYLSCLDIGAPLKPDTGSFEFEINNELIPLRFSYINNISSISCVLRILNNSKSFKIDSLSRIKEQNGLFKRMIEKRNGLVLFSGPTGSGKTTTLYTILKDIKGKVIFSIEDPIEVMISNIIQLEVNEENGFTYGEGIKQILRHDPDIIMIGEIRDEVAARMAIRAANTGHLVLSTIHASSAKNAITRMIELGVSEDNLYEVLIVSSNQLLISDCLGNKQVIYEIMDEKEIDYFKRNKENTKEFIDLDSQYKRGVEDGFYG